MRTVAVAYIPVFHEGYRRFIEESGAQELHLLHPSVSHAIVGIARDMRAVEPKLLAMMLNQTKGLVSPALDLVSVVNTVGLRSLAMRKDVRLILPDEDVSRYVAKRFFGRKRITFIPFFLRWDGMAALSKLPPDEDIIVTSSEAARKFLRQADELSKRSSDFWRQIGAIAVTRDGKRLAAFNESVPPQQQYANGDPRSNFQAGEMIECSLFMHAERALLTAAASRKNISLRGADIYQTVFPCVSCAQMLAEARVRSVYFKDGYANLNGREALRNREVKVVRVSF
ncbi:MAG: dCMP deaminase [Parcubacteria group bacterium LiPW_30]|nr:MAG: dCMP deaminase [Parcubacteria group bacterium LiPW_30]